MNTIQERLERKVGMWRWYYDRCHADVEALRGEVGALREERETLLVRIAELEADDRLWIYQESCKHMAGEVARLREALERIDAEATQFTLPAVLIAREALAGGGQEPAEWVRTNAALNADNQRLREALEDRGGQEPIMTEAQIEQVEDDFWAHEKKQGGGITSDREFEEWRKTSMGQMALVNGKLSDLGSLIGAAMEEQWRAIERFLGARR